jgi:OTU domain-containing protein 6
MAATASTSEQEWASVEELITAQKKELRQLADQQRVQVKRASKKDQPKVKAEFEKKIQQLEEQHQAQQQQLRAKLALAGGSDSPAPTPASAEEEEEEEDAAGADSSEPAGFRFQQVGLSKAQQRRQKKQAAERARREEIDKLNAATVDYRQLEIDQITNQLQPLGQAIHLIKPDGNCLFSAVSHQLVSRGIVIDELAEHMPPPPSRLRTLAVDYMRAHPDDFAPFVDEAEAPSFDEYLQRMLGETIWGSQLEIQALAHRWNQPFRIYTATAPIDIGAGAESTRAPLLLTFHRHFCALGDHYNSVVDR